MYVRTSALVTNLGVHFKLGRENAVAWVTTLDKGQPVPGRQGARVGLPGQANWRRATTDAQRRGHAEGLSPRGAVLPSRMTTTTAGLFRQRPRHRCHGVEDMAFTWSDWTARH
jgi:hypothetical protein